MTRRTGHTAIIERAFKGLDKQAVDMLRRVAVKSTYPANTVLCHEGDPADRFYVITDGRVIITKALEGTDEDFVLGFLTDGEYFGEMGIITEEPRGATVTTIVDTEVLEISKKDFDSVFSSSPAMARSILNTLIRIIRETDTRAIEDLEKRVEELRVAYKELEAAQADRIAKAALEAQLEVAARAQRSLLPTELPQVEGFEFAAKFEPARQVGGDFYDVRLLESGQVAILLADVSDKGAHAALFMAVARTLFLNEEKYVQEPEEVMTAVHYGLIASSAYDMFVTALYGVLDPETNVFRYVRGGHDEPLYIHNDGMTEFLGGSGRFLGLWPELTTPFKEQQVQLKSGDCLVIYSDGVTDMRNPEGEAYGAENLASLVRGLRMYDADRIAQSIYSVVQQHRAGAEAFDDFSLLVIRAR
nr:SpoIIE family protein phosphatase [Anaerolineae bacterium]